ncbi:hypothetical protein BO70DRAFT_203502 [Aspergillus heteromorphus CBS 117.55]|uniref:Uncharacterized protein n=1 Tax=Aspergillus heteromorphus CBS 117.55 TaxID=1448321 RepID=A0A317UX36_9EURO|nr:uncharacterized protein BO70DRAFT_203502 [Aspergillus heteromorphus CBS 117.55]PWY64540.1 hypothetical protein BO70DRAFT_203502 [Aspergillus heteromorphus CBS 117.55]
MAPATKRGEKPAAPANDWPDKGHTPTHKAYDGHFSRHPIPQLQGPFEESIIESIELQKSERITNLDAQSRRRNLIERPEYERLCGRKWRQRADERYHPLWKLTAQMSFGVHLLFEGLAKSDVEVLKILQVHVDEIDGFIGRTSEDFLIIQIDVRTRTQYLKLPLQNLDIFDEMLDERSFRLSMIDYNDRIEHAIERFTAAIRDALKDVQKGREAIGALWAYLRRAAQENDPLSAKMLAVYKAMLANSEGWNVAFSKLYRRGFALQSALFQLGLAITEMQRRVGVASRKSVVSYKKPSGPYVGIDTDMIQVSYMQTCKSISRGKSLRERLIEKGASITAAASPPNKPLPRAPELPGTATFLKSKECHRMMQKSVPNLRAAKEKGDYSKDTKRRGRASSVNGPSGGLYSEGIIPRLRRLSRPRLKMERSAGDNLEPTAARPSTAPSRTSKAQSVSLEQKKPLHVTRKEQPLRSQGTFLLAQAECSATAQTSLRREAMKNQLLQYFRSDRVMDAWEYTTQKEGRNTRHSSQLKKNGPWSIFCTESSHNSGTPMDLETNTIAANLKANMAWLHDDSDVMNTYSLKPKRNVDPRVHVFSVHLNAAEDNCEAERPGHSDNLGTMVGDAQITALPSIPASLRSRENVQHHPPYRRRIAEPANIFT